MEESLPKEVDYLKKYDELKHFINNYFELPNRLVDLVIKFLTQNEGKFSKRALRKEFSALTSKELTAIEEKFAEIFGEKYKEKQRE